MLEAIQKLADMSQNASLFIGGMALIYATGLMLLVAVAFKFVEHAARPQKLAKSNRHPISTFEMTMGVLMLFPFWLNSWGQMPMRETSQLIYFSLGCFAVVVALAWHVWAKISIRRMWSDGIEIKQDHQLITSGAFATARHPMYASLFLWCAGASLVMMNALTLVLTAGVILPLLYIRARDEERELLAIQPDYLLYQRNVRMLTPTLQGRLADVIKISVMSLFGYCLYAGIDKPEILLLVAVHLYLGFSLLPEKVAFSYRSKSGLMLVIWALSLVWPPVIYVLYVMLAMFVYGLKFDCPCMMVYNKHQRCPCFSLLGKCMLKK